MDRSEGERRAARRPKDQPETEGSRASRSRRSVTARSAEAASRGDKTGRRRRQNRPAPLCFPRSGKLPHLRSRSSFPNRNVCFDSGRTSSEAERMPAERRAEQNGACEDEAKGLVP